MLTFILSSWPIRVSRYLLDMPISSLSAERVATLKQQEAETAANLAKLRETSVISEPEPSECRSIIFFILFSSCFCLNIFRWLRVANGWTCTRWKTCGCRSWSTCGRRCTQRKHEKIKRKGKPSGERKQQEKELGKSLRALARFVAMASNLSRSTETVVSFRANPSSPSASASTMFCVMSASDS